MLGTGWCLNRDCDWVITNYHVVKIPGEHVSVKGVKAAQIATPKGEHDLGTPISDIALIRVREPLSRTGMRAVPFYTGDLQPGQSVTVLGYSGGKRERITGTFAEESDQGVLRFDLSQEVSPGISGGLVLDEPGRAIGLVFGISVPDAKAVYAVPVWSVAAFVHGLNPDLYASVFGNREDFSVDAAALDSTTPQRSGIGSSPILALPEVYLVQVEMSPTSLVAGDNTAPAVMALRRSAQVAAEQLKNFTARQTLRFSGGKTWQHELQLVDGVQRFKSLGGGKDFLELPSTPQGPVPGSDWADLVRNIASNHSLSIQFEGNITVDGRVVKIFRYQMHSEADICQLRVPRPFRRPWKGSLPLTGVIWTDQEFRLLRITKDMLAIPPLTGLASFRIAILYGWWGERVVPAEMQIQEVFLDGTSISSIAKFENYREFMANSRIVLGPQWWEEKSLRAHAVRGLLH